MKKTAIWKRIFSLLLCLAMVLSIMPSTLFSDADAAEESAFKKTVDPSTMNGWTEFFGPNKLST